MKPSFSNIISKAAALLAAGSLAASCTFDDASLWDEINSVTDQVIKLERATEYLQEQVGGMQELIAQIQENNLVESVTLQDDGDWTIVFSNGKTVEIVYEKIPEVTIPTLTVKQEGGTWYWAFSKGDKIELITDINKRKIAVKTDIAPKARVTGTVWELSFDEGINWINTGVPATGEGTDTLFYGLSEDADRYYITLADGVTVLPLEKAKGLSFKFVADNLFYDNKIYLEPGSSHEIAVEQANVANLTVFKPDGWKAEISGNIFKITTPAAGNSFAQEKGEAGVIAVGTSGKTLIAKFKVGLGERPLEPKIKIQWTTAPDFFTELRLGSAYEEGAIDLEPANSFVVTPGLLYRFRANVMGRGAEGVKALGLTGEVNRIENFTINGDASILPSIDEENEYVYFRTTTVPWEYQKLPGEFMYFVGGNGVISLTLNDEVRWTWMICSREEDLNDQKVGGYTQMGSMLGAWGPVWNYKQHIGDLLKAAFTPYLGIFYSWGSNNPQPGHTEYNRCYGTTASGLLGANMDLIYYYDTGAPVERKIRQGQPVTGLAESIRHPEVLSNLVSEGEDIYAHLWGGVSGSDKTIFDPCPYGYRVPDAGLYDSYVLGMPAYSGYAYSVSTGTEYVIPSGMIGMGEVVKTTGYKPLSDDEQTMIAPCFFGLNPVPDDYTIKRCYYWSNQTSPEGNNVATAYFIETKQNRGNEAVLRQNAAPVRCIRFDGER